MPTFEEALAALAQEINALTGRPMRGMDYAQRTAPTPQSVPGPTGGPELRSYQPSPGEDIAAIARRYLPVVDLLATPKGMEIASGGERLINSTSGMATHLATTPSRVGNFVQRSVDAGGFENMPPSEVGSMAVDAGMFPLMGAAGGVPRNAAGQVGGSFGSGGLAAMAKTFAATAGGGTAAYEAGTQWGAPDFSWAEIAKDSATNAGIAGLGALAIALPALGVEAVRTAKRLGNKAPANPALPPAYQARTSEVKGPPPVGQGPGPASLPQAAGQSTGNQSSTATLSPPSGDYTDVHTAVARKYLDSVMGNQGLTVTPTTITADLAKLFRANGLDVPRSLRDRAVNTMDELAKHKNKAASEDWMDRRQAISRSTGKPGLLSVGAPAGAIGAASQNNTSEPSRGVEFRKRGKDGRFKKGFTFKPRGESAAPSAASIADIGKSAMKNQPK